MRAIWKGAVSFGLVPIPVRLYSATEEKDIRFHQVHQADGGRIRYKRICSVDGAEVSYDEIGKGYDLGGGETVILTDEDFTDLPLPTSRTIDVLEFVPVDQIDPILRGKSYYLEPEQAAVKPYVLLRDALAGAGRVAVVKVALRQREQLATLWVREGVLVLSTLLWPDEVRPPDFDFLDQDVRARSQELTMAASLINSLAGDFSPDAYSDDYRAALQQVIDAKISGREITRPEEERPPVPAVDLMSALSASVDRARSTRGGSEPARTGEASPAAPEERTQRAAPARKGGAAKKAPAKKAGAGPRGDRPKKATGARKKAGAMKEAAEQDAQGRPSA